MKRINNIVNFNEFGFIEIALNFFPDFRPRLYYVGHYSNGLQLVLEYNVLVKRDKSILFSGKFLTLLGIIFTSFKFLQQRLGISLGGQLVFC